MAEAHVPPSVQFKVVAAAAGDDEFVGHRKRDHINYVNRLRMKKIEGGDVATLINLLTSRQAEEPGFFFRVQFNEEGRLSNIFWREVMMREDYLLYRDVIIFDTTYRTNRSIPHQDIGYVSGTFNKTQYHFAKLKGDRLFQNIFNKCLNGCYNESEFEETWHKMLKDYGLDQGHSWFKRLYKHRVIRSTTLNNEYFSAGILSSQRSESTNHAMGFQASKTTSVTAFFGIFKTTVRRWRSEEERKEFNGIRSTPTSVYPLADLLLDASQVYTVELFRIFEREFALAMGTRATFLPVDVPLLVYNVQPAATKHLITKCHNVVEARLVFEKLCVKVNKEVQSLLSKLSMDEEQRNEDLLNVDLAGPPILDPIMAVYFRYFATFKMCLSVENIGYLYSS
ncbi:protein FAR1-RELATED SEQUENCE 5-like [Silene latifolia]|uniref:protein FAR1-RELATED SEQUENCE 5-like n=1 Tax=Silene latifolia TaxID=37657 RepID=UPI003D777B7A